MKCRLCGKDYEQNMFSKNRKICIFCKREQDRIYSLEHKEDKKIYDKKRYSSKREEIKKAVILYSLEHKEEKKIYDKEYREKNWGNISKKKLDYEKERKKKDPYYKIRRNISSLLNNYLKKNINTKNTIGYNTKEIKEHLEKQFDENMSWNNYGSYWQIDHIIPQSLYDFSNDLETKKCWNINNLRPLEKKENNKKSNSLDISLIEQYKIENLIPINIKGYKNV